MSKKLTVLHNILYSLFEIRRNSLNIQAYTNILPLFSYAVITYTVIACSDLPGLKGEMFIVQTFVGDNLSSLGPDKRAIYICKLYIL